MVQHFNSKFRVSSSFPHIPSSSQTKKTHALHIQNAWKSTIQVATLQLPSCNISIQNFIVPSPFAHPQLISIQKNACIAHSKHMGTYRHGCHIATPIVQHFISEFLVSSSLQTPSAPLRPETTCIGHSSTWKLRLPHYYSCRGTFYFRTSLCPFHLHTSPAHLKLKTRCIAHSERMATYPSRLPH